MAESVQVAAYEGGELRFLTPETATGEVVLALPLNRLLVKMVRVSEDQRGDLAAFALPILQAMNPYPDDQLQVSCEVVRETEAGPVVIASALPESAADDIAELLDAKHLNVTRVDALPLGVLRGLWGVIGVAEGRRKLLLIGDRDAISVIVVDGDQVVAVRAVDSASDLRREVTLSLLEAEDFGGAKPLAETLVVGGVEAEGLDAFAPIRRLEVGEDAALVGVAERTAEPGTLNALPFSWGEVLAESRFKVKLRKWLLVSAAVWLALVGVIFGVPQIYGWLTSRQEQLSDEHARVYGEVASMRDKVEMIREYSDRSRGALELLRAISGCLPEGVTVNDWWFERARKVTISGDAEMRSSINEFTDALRSLRVTTEDGEAGDEVFRSVEPGEVAERSGRQQFRITCLMVDEEEYE